LFLTDLRGLDVLLGKLAATSLHGFYGLLAFFPVLALPLFIGGVTGAELGRLWLLMLVTLLFSLATGILVSTLSQETHQTVLRSLLAVLFFAGICPMIWWFLYLSLPAPPFGDALLWPSPGFAFIKGLDDYYKTANGPQAFWGSAGTVFLLGLVFLVMAGFVLPRAWKQEKGVAMSSPGPTRWRFSTLGWGRERLLRRREWLAANPFGWLAGRDPSPNWMAWIIAGMMLPAGVSFTAASIWGVDQHQNLRGWILFSLVMAYSAHQLFKILVTLETTRRFSEDRRSGALELLLVTPLTEREILDGQRLALRRHFKYPQRALLIANLILFLFVRLFPDPLSMGGHDGAIFTLQFLAGALVLYLDTWAICWTGMCMALRSNTHYRAAAATLGRILAPPWLGLLLMFFFATAVGKSGDLIFGLFGLWFVLGMALDLAIGFSAQKKLAMGFRPLACQDSQQSTPIIGREMGA
jgi:hypothetical protein